MLSGNAQLLKIHEQKDDLAAKLGGVEEERRRHHQALARVGAAAGVPAFANGLPEGRGHGRVHRRHHRKAAALLAEPDPVPELTKQLATALRLALGKLQDDLAAAFSKVKPSWPHRPCGPAAPTSSAPPSPRPASSTAAQSRHRHRRRDPGGPARAAWPTGATCWTPCRSASPVRWKRPASWPRPTPCACRCRPPSSRPPGSWTSGWPVVRQQVEEKLKNGPVIL
jgi:hypothetical protein